MDTNVIHTGDSFDVLDDLSAESIHACVCDPPYGLNFMSRTWDDFEPKEYQEWCEEWARKVKRVLKPGSHLLAFSGNRTHHRLFSGVEDAGYEIRDSITWHYGSGFPKSSDISKTIDKRADAEREVVGRYESPEGTSGSSDGEGVERMSGKGIGGLNDITEPATDAAKKWDGWKTGLKPATEYVVVARKPFDGATVDCVLEHGTGALNIDECRVSLADDEENPSKKRKEAGYSEDARAAMSTRQHNSTSRWSGDVDKTEASDTGRYPANVVFDETAADDLDASNEHTQSSDTPRKNSQEAHDDSKYGDASEGGWVSYGHSDSGGPSRYFYTSKASKAERTLDGTIDNPHPTVKPSDLMEWLVKLVTREGQIVLDPFAGSGTTLKAAKTLNREFVGIEQKPEYADLSRVRVGLTPEDPSTVRDDENQQGLEAFE